mgnify:FL=1
MGTTLFTGISLVAAFVGGMVALFAPCCITFLFTSYLGTIFNQRSRIVFLTLVFSLGLGAILIPVAFGFRFIISFFDQFHTTVYLIGALIMFIIGVLTLLDIKLMLPVPHYTMPQKTTVGSTFILGVFSGITSSCCAPVLFAAITLSTLSPTIASSFLVSVVYVFGIVTPLFLMSLVYDRITNQYLYSVKKKMEKPLKIIAACLFMISSVVISIMAVTGKITMDTSTEYSNTLRTFIYSLSSRIQNPVLDIVVMLGIITFVVVAIKQAVKK